jgi:hypothetical protein
MNELVKQWFESGAISYILTSLTLGVVGVLILGSIRVLIEDTIPTAFEKCCKSYFICKHASVIAYNNIEKQNQNESK